MTVVPTGGNITAPLLACGWAEWLDFADADDPALLVAVAAVAAAVADAGPDDPLLAGAEPDPAAEVEPDDPPHAASSRTNEPIPVAAAHPLLRITSLQFPGMTRSSGKPVQAFRGEPNTKTLPGRHRDRPGNAGSFGVRCQPPAMLLLDSLITCHTPPTPLPETDSAFAPLNMYSGMPL